MTDAFSPGPIPLVWAQDDIQLRGNKRAKMICIVESVPPEDLKEAIESLIEIGLSQVELMREILQVIEELLRADGRFDALARDIGRYREIVFKEDRCLPFTMIEARAIMSTIRKWITIIDRRLETQQV